MITHRPAVLTIAGFDPSGGAGLMADCKTMESHKVTAMGAVTCLTFQNEESFNGLNWMALEDVLQQLEVLLQKHAFKFIKIGMVQGLEFLQNMIEFIIDKIPHAKIIWDPVMKASAGFVFHAAIDTQRLETVCQKLYLVTPNWNEITKMYPTVDPLQAAAALSFHCKVYLKGGHHPTQTGRDYIFERGKHKTYQAKVIAEYDKHGTGCVFSSALAANLARGYSLHQSCLRSKSYINGYLASSKSKLGHHKL